LRLADRPWRVNGFACVVHVEGRLTGCACWIAVVLVWIDAEQAEAEQLLAVAQINTQLVEERLEIALSLLQHCDRLYTDADETARRSLNQAFFAELHLDEHGVVDAVLNPPFAQLIDRTIDLIDDDPDSVPSPQEPVTLSGTTRPGLDQQRRAQAAQGAAKGHHRKNPAAYEPRGSNLTLMAEREGFEPSTHLSARTRFPVALLRPLGHLSGSNDIEPQGYLATTRRKRQIASAAKTTAMPTDQAIASAMSSPAGVPRNKARTAFTIFVNGLCVAIG
jgi:hypothetical protein